MDKLKKKYCSLILCAGYGSRMKSIGRTKHKSLIKINEKTLLENILFNLSQFGIKDHVIATGYKENSIKKILKKYKNLNFKLVNIKNFKTRGSSYSLFKASKYCLNYKNILMTHADIFFDNLLLKKVIDCKKKNVIGYVKKKHINISEKGFIIKFDKTKEIQKLDLKKNFKKKTNNEIICINKFTNIKLKKLREYLKKYFKDNDNRQTWEVPFNLFINKNNEKFYAAGLKNKFWFNINTYEEMMNAKKYYLENLKI